MSVLVDPPYWPAHGRLWSHLVSDTSFDELHAFANRVGLDRRLFEGDHYDVPEDLYPRMLASGAQPVESRVLLQRLQQAGLRRRKRRGEKVLGSAPGPDGSRLDVVLSTLPVLGAPVTGVWLVVPADGGVLVRPHRDGLLLPGPVRPGGTASGVAAPARRLGLVCRRRAGTDQLVAVQEVAVLDVPADGDPVAVLRSHAAAAATADVRWEPGDLALAGLAGELAPLVEHVLRAG